MMIVISACFGLVGVALGAVGEHMLAASLSAKQMKSFTTAVDYHQLYSVLIIGLELFRRFSPHNTLITRSMVIGFLLACSIFSGTIYAYLWTGIKGFIYVTPVGGFGLMGCWGYLAWRAYRVRRDLDKKEIS